MSSKIYIENLRKIFMGNYIFPSLKERNIIVGGRKSPYSLFREQYVTFSKKDVHNQKNVEGFINLIALFHENKGEVKVKLALSFYSKIRKAE